MLRRMVGHPSKNKESYDQRDAIKLIDSNSSPILIVHGGKDKQVGIHHAYYLEEQLKLKVLFTTHFINLMKGMYLDHKQ